MLSGLLNLGKKDERTFSVLAVSDSADDLGFVKTTLEANGFVVHAVSDATTALTLLEDITMPDLFIGDFRDPETDGTEFIGKIRVRFGRSALSPIIFLLDSPEDEEVAHAMDVRDVLPKPLQAQALLKCVQSILESETQD